MSNNMAVVGGKTGQVLANSSTWTELKAGSTRLMGRKWLLIQNKSRGRIAIATSTTNSYRECPEVGISVIMQIPVSDDVPIYVKSRSLGGSKISVMELA